MMLISALFFYSLSASCMPLFGGNPPYTEICAALAARATPEALEHCKTADDVIGIVFDTSTDMRGRKAMRALLQEKQKAKERKRDHPSKEVASACGKLIDTCKQAKDKGVYGALWLKVFFQNLGNPTDPRKGYTPTEIDRAMSVALDNVGRVQATATADEQARVAREAARRQREIEDARKSEADRAAEVEAARIRVERAEREAALLRQKQERDAEIQREQHEARQNALARTTQPVVGGSPTVPPALKQPDASSVTPSSGMMSALKTTGMIVGIMLILDAASHQEKSLLAKLGSGIARYAEAAFQTVKGWFAGAHEQVEEGSDPDSIIQQFLDGRENDETQSADTDGVSDETVTEIIAAAQEEFDALQETDSFEQFLGEVTELGSSDASEE